MAAAAGGGHVAARGDENSNMSKAGSPKREESRDLDLMDISSTSPRVATKSQSEAKSKSAAGSPADDDSRSSADMPKPSSASSAAPAKRKKGTATAVKGGKKPKGRPATKKKVKGGGSANKKVKTAKSAASSGDSDPDSDEDDDEDDGGAGEDEESDHGPYCICRGPDDHRWMISCDGCEDWFHGECVKISKDIGETLIQSYICPNCTDGKEYVTRYKKMCSLKGCMKPARVDYDDRASSSVFCSQEHRDQWWDRQVAALPKSSRRVNEYRLTQEEFTGLLASSSKPGVTWKLGDAPFDVPSNFWDTVDHDLVFTAEEKAILSSSAADRHKLGEETVLCKKMLELLDMANERHRAAVVAGALEKNACGYDVRLDTVNAMAQFERFAKSPEGEAIFRTGKLEAPLHSGGEAAEKHREEGRGGEEEGEEEDRKPGEAVDARTEGMCKRRKCGAHAGWYNMHARQARGQMKELAREAKERLDREERVRNGAAVRFLRKQHERNSVTALDPRVDNPVQRNNGPGTAAGGGTDEDEEHGDTTEIDSD